MRAKELRVELKKDPERWGKRLAAQRKARTGFTPEQVEDLLVAQKNRCAVCQKSFEGKQVRADHCHDSGKPRGLLCHHCNIIEGMLRGMGLSAYEFARRMSDYLAHPPILSLEN
jgi:hypothetical protein